MTLEEIARIAEIAKRNAWADFYACAPVDSVARYGICVEYLGSAVAAIAEGIDDTLFNRVIGLGIAEPTTEATIDRIVERYRRAEVRRFAVQLSPAAQPSALPAWLQARGLVGGGNSVQMYRGSEPPPAIPTDLRIERIGKEDAAAFAEIACDVFRWPDALIPWIAAAVGRPRWQHYLAFDGKVPVATGALFVEDKVGWLGFGATLPSHRSRGAQGGIIAQRIRDGLGQGRRWLASETAEDLPARPNPSYRNMVRTGFKLACRRLDYTPQRPARAPRRGPLSFLRSTARWSITRLRARH